jgi:hypothetical protein
MKQNNKNSPSFSGYRYLLVLILGLLWAVELTVSLSGSFLRASRIFAAILAVSAIGISIRGIAGQKFRGEDRFAFKRKNILATFAVFVLMVVDVHNSFNNLDIKSSSDLIINIALAGIKYAFFYTFVELLWLFPVHRWPSVLGFGLAGYTGINILGYKAGLQGVHGGIFTSIEALEGTLGERMIAPFGGGLNNYGILAILGLSLCLGSTFLSFREKDYRMMALNLLGASVSAYGAFLSQTRSGLIVAVGILLWNIPLGRTLRLIFLPAFSLTPILVPLIFDVLIEVPIVNQVINSIIPEWLFRYQGELFTLGGRTLIWKLGRELILGGQIPILGLGIGERDAGGAIGQSGTGFQFSFHNSFLDVVAVYGIIIGLAIWIIYLVVTFRICRQISENKKLDIQDEQAASTMLIGLGLSSMLEAVSTSEVFWFLLIICTYSVLKIESSSKRSNSNGKL